MSDQENTSAKKVRAFALRLFLGFPFAGILWTVVARATTGIWHLEIFGAFIAMGWLLALACTVSPAFGRSIRASCRETLHFVERIVSRIALAFAFFLAITPFALFRRALGRDPLLQRKSTAAKRTSYWSAIPKSTKPDNCHEQF